MTKETMPVLVFGATGQRGGSVAKALLTAGWAVRAFVKDTESTIPAYLADAEIARGDLSDAGSIRAAMTNVRGVYLALPSSATAPGMTDENEIQWGMDIADAAEGSSDDISYVYQAQ